MDNKYSKWTDIEEFKKSLLQLKDAKDVKTSSLPLAYDDKSLFTNAREGHTFIIGATGSGKTQSISLPKIYLGELAGESFIISDDKGEIYDIFAPKMKKDGYEVVAIDFASPDYGDMWNPFTLPYKLYKEGNENDAIYLLEELASVIFSEKEATNVDPFWNNSCESLLVGLSLYMFDKSKEEDINILNIISLSESVDENLLKTLDKKSPAYFNLCSIAKAPTETRGSIISVFNQRMKLFASRPNLSSMLSKTTFDLNSLGKKKIAIFLIGNNISSSFLTPVFVRQCCYLVEANNTEKKRFNIILDDFDSLRLFPSFAQLLSEARGYNVTFCLLAKSLISLKEVYQEAEFEIIRSTMSCLIYLFANDDYTLKYFSNICGTTLEKGKEVPLISEVELKVLKPFEAIVIMNRMYPIRTKLLPFYQYPGADEYMNSKCPLEKR